MAEKLWVVLNSSNVDVSGTANITEAVSLPEGIKSQGSASIPACRTRSITTETKKNPRLATVAMNMVATFSLMNGFSHTPTAVEK